MRCCPLEIVRIVHTYSFGTQLQSSSQIALDRHSTSLQPLSSPLLGSAVHPQSTVCAPSLARIYSHVAKLSRQRPELSVPSSTRGFSAVISFSQGGCRASFPGLLGEERASSIDRGSGLRSVMILLQSFGQSCLDTFLSAPLAYVYTGG
jgi:hypothetical protein